LIINPSPFIQSHFFSLAGLTGCILGIFLHTEVKKELKIKLQNRYQELQRAEDQNEDKEDIWDEAKSALTKSAEEVIGYRERGRKSG
jgi:hypothetical protein